ncbi:unnamed protein product [Protopolystoma xenopodis]|uniref:Secreted protein n=1 Tax=Protopolystoma xenopodis TaxID=117903 RepID=A0A3S5AF62_9PLAT|nr:unnamed protein product [Protopolystoma xenopodis]
MSEARKSRTVFLTWSLLDALAEMTTSLADVKGVWRLGPFFVGSEKGCLVNCVTFPQPVPPTVVSLQPGNKLHSSLSGAPSFAAYLRKPISARCGSTIV